MQRDDSIHERLADRLANILTKLNMGHQLTIKELSCEFKVSTRTISRDFDRLNTYLPLLQDEVSKKYYLESNYLGKISPKDIRNFAQISGISHLYPSLDISFLRELLDTHGVKLAMASTILRFRNPNLYQIIDQRVFRFIYPNKDLSKITTKKVEQIEIYLQYLEDLREICQSKNVDFNLSDRIFYALDKEKNKDHKLNG